MSFIFRSNTFVGLTALTVVAVPAYVQAQTAANQQVNTPAQAALGLYGAWYEGNYRYFVDTGRKRMLGRGWR